MAKIGLSIASDAIENILNVSSVANRKLIGLNLKPNIPAAGLAVVMNVARVYLTDDLVNGPIEFEAVAALNGIVYRSNGTDLVNTNSGSSATNDEFEFYDPSKTNFAFFSKDALEALIAISNNLIVSGAGSTSGEMAYPVGANSNKRYGTLLIEVDRGNGGLKILNHQNEARNKKIPAAIASTPCPPYWNPF